MWQVVVDGLRHTHANHRVTHLLGDLGNFPGRIHGIVAAVVEEIADIVGLEDFDQAFVLRPVLFEAFQLVATGPEGTTRRLAQAGNIGVGFEAGVDQVFGQGTNDAIAPGIHFPDFLGMPACFLNQATRRRIDDGGYAP